MKSIRVLFADDDPDMRQLVGMVMQFAGIRVEFAENGTMALVRWRNGRYDLVILDIMMPEMDGVEACRRIRQESNVPIILLTAKTREQDVVEGLYAGADDYVMKPFRPKELVARIHAVLGRAERKNGSSLNPLSCDDLVLDQDAQRVVQDGKPIQVTPLEYRLLRYMMIHKGIVLTKRDILRNVWGYTDSAGELNLIETAIHRLRLKIEKDPSQPNYIHTVWGSGYRFSKR